MNSLPAPPTHNLSITNSTPRVVYFFNQEWTYMDGHTARVHSWPSGPLLVLYLLWASLLAFCLIQKTAYKYGILIPTLKVTKLKYTEIK